MLGDREKAPLKELELSYPCAAMKHRFEKPDAPHYDGGKLAYCRYAKYAQETGNHFYITAEDDVCYGKMPLGTIGKPSVTASGQVRHDLGIYKSPIGAQRLYQKPPALEPNTIRYVKFCPAEGCDFDSDFLFFVSDFPQADVIMRTTSYISGGLWESKPLPVISCVWMYVHSVTSGKVNHITTGFYRGLKRRKVYPAGLRTISVPYQKLPEFFATPGEMDWTMIAFRGDAESKRELQRRMEHWQEMARASGTEVDLY